MTTGALIFAFDNDKIDYVEMAAWSADNIRRHLDIPVAVITDCTDQQRLGAFDHVITATADTGGNRYFEDYKQTVIWHNASRTQAYDLSPWDQTLLLDADYVVASDSLKEFFSVNQDFLCYKDAFSVNQHTGQWLDDLNSFGQYRFPMWWATVILFRKSQQAKTIFDCMGMVRKHWNHYLDLYQIRSRIYRNDFALSIALGIESAHTLTTTDLPGGLCSVLPEQHLFKVNQDHYQVQYQDTQGRWKRVDLVQKDFHAMGKLHLGEIVETDRRTRLSNSCV